MINNLGDLVSLLAKTTTRKKNIRVQRIRSTSSFYVKERKQKYQKKVSDQIRKRKREKNKYLKLFLKSLL
jgi:Holliday junction resolvase RusA-like endonuclease